MDPTSPSRRRDGTVFEALTKLAATTPTPERTESSGLIDLRALSSEHQPATEAQAPPARATDVTLVPEAHTPFGARKVGRPVHGLHIMAFLVGAAGVVAAVLAVVGMRRSASETPLAIVAARPSPQAASKTATASLPGVAPASVATSDEGVDPSALPPADVNDRSRARQRQRESPPVVVAAPATATSIPSASGAASDPKPAEVVTASSATSGDGQSLRSLMQQAVGVTSDTAAATATAMSVAPPSPEGSIPVKPSVGAIQSALRAALPAARACLDPDDPISRVVITFQSDGSARSVSVSGGAAGKPAEACIRGALMKARVPAFALSTYAVPATIRPD